MLCPASWHYSEMINTESQRWSIQRSSRWGTNQNGYSLGWGLVLAYLGPTWWILGGSFGTTCSTVITLAPLGGLLVTKVISHYLLAECDSAYIHELLLLSESLTTTVSENIWTSIISCFEPAWSYSIRLSIFMLFVLKPEWRFAFFCLLFVFGTSVAS